MIVKGGVGSGITGHKILKEVIANLSPKQRRAALGKLRNEKKRRGDEAKLNIGEQDKKKSFNIPQQEINNFIYNVLKYIKIMKKDSIVKEMSKDDWIQAWRDNPHDVNNMV